MAETPNVPDPLESETPEQPAPSQSAVPPAEEIPPSPEAPAAGRPKAPDLKTPSGSRRVMYTLFSPETRTGRFLRALLRTLALVVGMFALGLLAAYLLLYRPTAQQLKDAHLQATQTAGDLQKARQDLSTSQGNLKSLQTQAADAQSRLEVEVARSQVLRAMNAVTLAQMAVQNNNKAAAVKNLDTAQGYLQTIQPLLEKRDSQQSSTIQAIVTLAKNDLDRDLKLAAEDLNRLQSELQRAESNVLK